MKEKIKSTLRLDFSIFYATWHGSRSKSCGILPKVRTFSCQLKVLICAQNLFCKNSEWTIFFIAGLHVARNSELSV